MSVQSTPADGNVRSVVARRYAAPLFLLFALIIALRRWPQTGWPQVAAEDGVLVLPSLIRSGWLAIFEPVNGYLIVPTKLVAWLALNLSFERYPNLSTGLSVLVEAACVCAVVFSPTILRYRLLCALALVLVPIGPEVFAAPLYLFWWTSLLGVLALLWSSERQQILRCSFIVIGGLSSPLLLALTPLFAGLAIVRRTRSELIAFVVALLSSAVQVSVMVGQSAMPSDSIWTSLARPLLILLKYFALPVAYMHLPNGPLLLVLGLVFGLAMLVALGGSVFVSGPRRSEIIVLLLILAAAIATSLARAPVTITNPWYAGPRYFFFATVFLAWSLLWISAQGTRLAILARVLLVLHLPIAALSFLERPFGAETVSWPDQVALCKAATTDYVFSIPTTGNPADAWSLTLSGDTCRELSRRSLLRQFG